MKNVEKCILILITGIQGSGKTTIGKSIVPFLKRKYGNTIYSDGDILRKKLKNFNYSKIAREKIDIEYFNFIKKKIKTRNIVFSTVSLSSKIIKEIRLIIPLTIIINIKSPVSFIKNNRYKIFKSIDLKKKYLKKDYDFVLYNSKRVRIKNTKKKIIDIIENKLSIF